MASLNNSNFDVLFELLAQAPNLYILWKLIRASAILYFVFRQKRNLILSKLITREIGHDILPDALSALRSSRLSCRGLEKEECIKWISRYKAELSSESEFLEPLLLKDVMPLLRTHREIKFLANLFVRDKLDIFSRAFGESLQSDGAVRQDHPIEALSATERSRIYRSLYRYAIYGNIFFHDPNKPREFRLKQACSEVQSHEFLHLFPACQVEELSCINDFMHDKILEKGKEMEDNYYNLLLSDPSSWDRHFKSPWWRRWEDTYTFFYNTESDVKALSIRQWQRYFATLSISDLAEIFAAKGEALQQVIKKHTHHRTKDFLPEALCEIPYHLMRSTPECKAQKQAIAIGVKVEFQKDALDLANEAWLWAHEYQSCKFYIEENTYFSPGEGLRRFGYVFWDSARLRQSNLLQEDPGEIAKMILEKFPRPVFGDSVEGRLRKLRKSQMELLEWLNERSLLE